jgi:hypothetical protein
MSPITVTFDRESAQAAARRLQTFMSKGPNGSFKLSHAYEAFAQTLGYANWNTLEAAFAAPDHHNEASVVRGLPLTRPELQRMLEPISSSAMAHFLKPVIGTLVGPDGFSVLMGPAGSGKSCLMRLAALVAAAPDGLDARVILVGHAPEICPLALAAGYGMVPADRSDLPIDLAVMKAPGLYGIGYEKPPSEDKALRLIESLLTLEPIESPTVILVEQGEMLLTEKVDREAGQWIHHLQKERRDHSGTTTVTIGISKPGYLR